jgi:hypothetical protein
MTVWLGNPAAPADQAAAVTPDNDDVFAEPTRFLWVGDGNTELTVTMLDGTTVQFTNVPDGSLLPIRVTQVKATGTDATDIVALW